LIQWESLLNTCRQKRGRRKPAPLGAFALVILAFSLGGSAGAQATSASNAEAPASDLKVSVAVESSDPSQRNAPVRYRIDASSAAGGDFELRLVPPQLRLPVGALGTREGATIQPASPVELASSPDSSARVLRDIVADFPCSPRGLTPHGTGLTVTEVGASLAPGGNVTLRVSYQRTEAPLWPGVDYRLKVEGIPLGEGSQGLRPAVSYGPQRKSLRPYGTRVKLTSKPSTGFPVESAGTLRVGQRLRLRGSTYPKLRRKLLTVVAAGPTDSRLKRVGRVRTDANGRFKFNRWAPKRTGGHEITVLTPAADRRVADYACPLAFDVPRRRR